MKLKIYFILKYLGFFKLSKALFRNKVLILAYHGFEINDESSFNGKLFIKRSTLEQRMKYLKKNNFNVVSLTMALKRLDEGKSLPNNSVVITIDDGWYSTITHADEIISKYSFPYTIYVTSYYAKKEIPVLNVLLRYLLWSYKEDKLEMNSLNIPGLKNECSFSDIDQKNEARNTLLTYFDSLTSTGDQLEFVKKISLLFGVDYNKIESDRYLSLLNLSEINKLSEKGVDIQLHTHRHNLPLRQRDKFENEIFENRSCLIPFVGNDLEHFCYPSGIYDQSCEETFKKIGVTSAATCEPGFVSFRSNKYYLPRFLDGENIPQIIFEAELSGVSEIFRRTRTTFRRMRDNFFQKTKVQ